MVVDHVDEVWEAVESGVAPEEPHEDAEDSTGRLVSSVNETFGEVDPDVAKVHQIANDYAAFNVVHYICSIEQT